MEYIKCIFCDDDNTEIFLKENNYISVKCKSCGLVYVNPRPKIEELKKIYEGNESLTTDINSFIRLKEKKLLLARKDIRKIQKFKTKGRILEIGSAAGYFLHTAKKYGYDVYGLDINDKFVKYSRNIMKLNIQCGTILNCTFPENYFDIIYMRNVLSHLYNPIEELNIINKLLKNKGLFIFRTGNAAELNPNYIKRIRDLGLPEHLFHYSRKNILQLLNKTNFQLIKKIEYSIHYREWLYALLGKKIRSTYKELKNNSLNANMKISYKQIFFARLDLLILSIGRILPKNNKWLSILYISEKV